MNKWKLLPKLAWTGVTKNGTVYFPYIGAGIFTTFTYFVFASILHNDLVKTLPNSMYAWTLLMIGKILLGIILLPFLYYTNGFLIKSRKKEIGLYSILGLEKKHIGTMMFIETAGIYAAALIAGIICGLVFSKLLFMLLMKMTGLPVEAEFTFSPGAFSETAIFFAIVYLLNLMNNLIQVGKSRPTELLSGSKKGEKEPRLLWVYALLGLVVLGWGYFIAATSKIDSMIFINFFLAVLLVVAGTYFLLTSGGIAFLKLVKSRKKSYYTPTHFVTVSGMLYRMKKSAASLVNICLFSTMVIITLICTSSLYLGLSGIQKFDYPYDLKLNFSKQLSGETASEEIARLLKEHQVKAEKIAIYNEFTVTCAKVGDQFFKKYPEEGSLGNEKITFLTLEDYNKMEGTREELLPSQVLVYCTGEDYGAEGMNFFEKEFQVKKELQQLYSEPKAQRNVYGQKYFVVVADEEVLKDCLRSWAQANGVEDIESFVLSGWSKIELNIEGNATDKQAFMAGLKAWGEKQPGFESFRDNEIGRGQVASMNGGLLFIGILFSAIFFMCLIMIMYYKQIAEGYEDKESFMIMQKVGMSEEEIRKTIRKQILMVFLIPLLGALLHTAVGYSLLIELLATLRLFQDRLIITCTAAVVFIFAVVYGISYIATAKTYYRIVRQNGQI